MATRIKLKKEVEKMLKNKILLVLIILLLFTFNLNAQDIVYQIPIEGDIDQAMFSFFQRGFNQAEENNADIIIIKIDTYGGYVDPAIKIKDIILNSDTKTVTFVSNRAWSAGALIAISGEQMIMQRGSSIGAAETRPNEEKYISALRKEFKSTAEARNKNPELAAAMVDVDIEIEGIIEKEKLLTLTAEEAVDNNISDYMVDNTEGLYQYLNISGNQVNVLKLTTSEKFAKVVTNPYISTFLLIIGFSALIFELLVPGFGFGGTIGLISLGMFFSGYVINGIASWGIILLFLVGLLLILLEVFVVPGFGITGIGGIASILISLYFLFPTPQIAINIIATTLIATIVATYFIAKYFESSKIWSKISLGTSQTIEVGYVASIGNKKVIGKKGITVTPLRPAGIAEIEGKRVDVVSEGGFIDKEEKIKVIDVRGSKVLVQAYKEGEN
ncbi:MAG: NfeD family protein [Halanaerobiales bacterium]|nr:NfeD family protein [Halanaerobiales bacterium]